MPLYGMTMMNSYPSRFIAPGIMLMAPITVLVHSSLLFRAAPDLLNLAYLAITLVCIVIHWHLAPYLVHTFQRNISSIEAKETVEAEYIAEGPVVPVAAVSGDPPLAQLTAGEPEILELIGGGYSNREALQRFL